MTVEQEIGLEALEALEESVRVLRRQLQNPRASKHHHEEVAEAVVTDARWLLRKIQGAAK